MWTVALEGGPRRVNHAAACVGDKIYSFGGYSTIDELNDWGAIQVHILNTHSLRWSAGPSFTAENAPLHRYGHTVVAVGEKIYLWGGRNNSIAFDDVSCFDTTTLAWSNLIVSGTIPIAKDGHSACVIKNKMYIFGGFEFFTNEYSEEVHCFDFATNEWTFLRTTGTEPSARDFHTAVAFGDYMYVFGGRLDEGDGELYSRHVYRLNTLTNIWDCPATVGDTPEGRRSHSAWFYDGYMYIFGGYNGRLKTHFNDLYRFSPKDNRWQEFTARGCPPCKRRRQSCIVHRDKMYLFGGTSPIHNDSAISDSEKTLDNSDLYVLDFKVSLRTLCILEVLKNDNDLSSLPISILLDIRAITEPNKISRPIERIS